MTKEKPGRCRLERIALDYLKKSFEWRQTVLELKETPHGTTVESRRDAMKKAYTRQIYYAELSNFTARYQKEPSVDVKRKLLQDAKIDAHRDMMF